MTKHASVIFVGLVFIFGCSEKLQMSAAVNNPTSFVFPFPQDTVISSAKRMGNYPHKYRHMSILTAKDTAFFNRNARVIFALKENLNDIYLHYFGGQIGKSYSYYIDGERLDYYVEFHIHFIPKGDSTEAQINVIEPRIAVGTEFLPSLPHLVREIKTRRVSPTTVEEYEILLHIGEGLGIKDKMPPIAYPDTSSIK
ncbi:hypothetical protein JNM05_06445 [bacterium]|nr:hypothetical protein [bacterium]